MTNNDFTIRIAIFVICVFLLNAYSFQLLVLSFYKICSKKQYSY